MGRPAFLKRKHDSDSDSDAEPVDVLSYGAEAKFNTTEGIVISDDEDEDDNCGIVEPVSMQTVNKVKRAYSTSKHVINPSEAVLEAQNGHKRRSKRSRTAPPPMDAATVLSRRSRGAAAAAAAAPVVVDLDALLSEDEAEPDAAAVRPVLSSQARELYNKTNALKLQLSAMRSQTLQDGSDSDCSVEEVPESKGKQKAVAPSVPALPKTISLPLRSTAGKLVRMKMKRDSMFARVFKKCAELAEVEVHWLQVWLGNRKVEIDTTPEKLGWKVGEVLTYRIVDPDEKEEAEEAGLDDSQMDEDPDMFKFVFVRDASRNRSALKGYYVHTSGTLGPILEQYAADQELELASLVFSFDGDHVLAESTPGSLDADSEDPNQIDCRIANP